MAVNPSPDLIRFVTAAKEKGASDEAVVSILENAGWSRPEVWKVLGRHYEALTQIPIPPGRKSVANARDASLYFLTFSMLFTWTIALGSICFILIDDWFKDPLAMPSYAINPASEISGQLAAIIVTFPMYLFLMRVILSDTRRTPEKLESAVRKWFTYLALVVAAGVMIGDVVTFLTYFLRGEITARFVSKVAVTLVISGGVFWYYLGSLREARKAKADAAD